MENYLGTVNSQFDHFLVMLAPVSRLPACGIDLGDRPFVNPSKRVTQEAACNHCLPLVLFGDVPAVDLTGMGACEELARNLLILCESFEHERGQRRHNWPPLVIQTGGGEMAGYAASPSHTGLTQPGLHHLERKRGHEVRKVVDSETPATARAQNHRAETTHHLVGVQPGLPDEELLGQYTSVIVLTLQRTNGQSNRPPGIDLGQIVNECHPEGRLPSQPVEGEFEDRGEHLAQSRFLKEQFSSRCLPMWAKPAVKEVYGGLSSTYVPRTGGMNEPLEGLEKFFDR